MSSNAINTLSPAPAVQTTSLIKESVWNKRTVRVGSGISAAGLAGGAIALGVLGGPIGAIVGVAAAALIALVMLIKSIVSKPKVTSVETQPAQEKTPEPAIQIEAAKTAIVEAPATEPTTIVAEEAPAETLPVETTTTTTEAEATLPAPKADRFQSIKNAYATAINFAKNHPYITGAAGLAIMAGLGYGAVAAYGALAAPAMTKGMSPLPAATPFIPTPKAPICVNPNLQTGQLLIAPPPAMTQPVYANTTLLFSPAVEHANQNLASTCAMPIIHQNVTRLAPEAHTFTTPLTQTIYRNVTQLTPEAPTATLTQAVYQNITAASPKAQLLLGAPPEKFSDKVSVLPSSKGNFDDTIGKILLGIFAIIGGKAISSAWNCLRRPDESSVESSVDSDDDVTEALKGSVEVKSSLEENKEVLKASVAKAMGEKPDETKTTYNHPKNPRNKKSRSKNK